MKLRDKFFSHRSNFVSQVGEARPVESEAPPAETSQRPYGSAMHEERFFLVLAVFIGIFSGLAVVCFRIAYEWVGLILLGSAQTPPPLRVILAPTVAGLVVALLVIWVFPTTRGSGVNQTKAALYVYNGYIPFRTAIGKFITSALAIGSGQSLGPEDPSLQIGAGIASALGRRLRLSRDKMRLIAPVGAAAGLAAAFNAPISSVLFVIEEVIGRWSVGVLGSVVLSSVSSVVVLRWFLGAEPMFRIPAVQLVSFTELTAYSVLGIVGGFASIVFAKGISTLRPRLQSAPHWTQYLQPAGAGLLIGLIGYLGAPQVMGAGYGLIDQAMHGQFAWKMLAVLASLKILATTLSFSSGTPGGMFAPTLFIGAMLGGAVGGVERLFIPHLTGSVGTYALVGMGVLFAGFLRVPLTSVFMVLELSGNYSIIVPVIVANTIAYLISRSMEPVPIFDMLSRLEGVSLPSMEELREEPILRVEDAMRPVTVPILNVDELLSKSVDRVAGSAADIVLVRGYQGWSCVPKDRLHALLEESEEGTTVGEVVPPPMPYLYPDQPLEIALRYIYEWPFLPVVHRAETDRLQGTITLKDVLNAYRHVHE